LPAGYKINEKAIFSSAHICSAAHKGAVMKRVPNKIEVVTIPETATIREAMAAIDRGAIGIALLSGENGRFRGLVSDGDIRRALLAGLGLGSPVTAVSRPQSITGRASMDAMEIMHLFSEPVRVVPLLNDADEVVDLAIFDRRLRLPVAEPHLGARELAYVSECILTGWVSSAGSFVTRFEALFAEFCGTSHAISTSSGTTALHLALLALEIGSGDEVIVPSLSFIATANAVTYTGATPVFVDNEMETWNIDPTAVAAAVTPRTKAIIPVHLYGHPARMEPIQEIAAAQKLAIIEDAAEAHGAEYAGRRVGGIGDLGVFSFYGNKIFTTGEGGMIVTNDSQLAEKCRILRDHGMSRERRYWHPYLGYNYRLTNIQAALGVAQLEQAAEILQEKARIATAYHEGLRDCPGVTLPPNAAWAKNVYWLYSILIDEADYGLSRAELMRLLQAKGIGSRPFFVPMHQQPIYNTGQTLPVAEGLYQRGISLPSAASITDDEIKYVCRIIRQQGR
jgi:perosamine synthetase